MRKFLRAKFIIPAVVVTLALLFSFVIPIRTYAGPPNAYRDPKYGLCVGSTTGYIPTTYHIIKGELPDYNHAKKMYNKNTDYLGCGDHTLKLYL